MRSNCRADQVKSRLDVRYPVPNCLVDSVFKGAAPACYGTYLGTQQFHTENVEGLALNIVLTHIDNAFQAKHGADSRGCNTMLTSPCFGNDALLAHALCQQALAESVIDLMRASMRQV